ncbi:hypothetical protein [Nocardioides sp. B-3]|uniref:hypothetical protein n=1 Tax=Nocardioides sp. B-3 TaxID=2895565 RepID=UPI002153122F|nr:hypothetical protein [Nocardioides sp. B-3]UUZ61140.1 hypothetical protein LP418_11255 [Nocardioides sp. B-3]
MFRPRIAIAALLPALALSACSSSSAEEAESAVPRRGQHDVRDGRGRDRRARWRADQRRVARGLHR